VTRGEFDADLFGRWNSTTLEYTVTAPLRSSDVFIGPGIHRDVVVAVARSLSRAGRYQVTTVRNVLLSLPRKRFINGPFRQNQTTHKQEL